jgi:hypothetical protein
MKSTAFLIAEYTGGYLTEGKAATPSINPQSGLSNAVETRIHKGWKHVYPAAPRLRLDSSLARDAAHFFSQPFACERLLDSFLFARLEIERVLLDILNDVFLLNLAFETAKSAFEGLAFVQNNFRQIQSPP